MPPRKKPLKVTPSATKAKLPPPKKKPKTPLRKAYEAHRATTDAPLTREDIDRIKANAKPGDGFHPIGTPNYDADKAREFNAPRAISCGEDTTTGAQGVWQTSRVDFDKMFPGSEPWWKPALRDKPNARLFAKTAIRSRVPLTDEYKAGHQARTQAFLEAERDRIIAYENAHLQPPPPDTSAYPWPLKWAWRVDGWIVTARTKLAAWLSVLAGKVKP